jgi:hypothetical protein
MNSQRKELKKQRTHLYYLVLAGTDLCIACILYVVRTNTHCHCGCVLIDFRRMMNCDMSCFHLRLSSTNILKRGQLTHCSIVQWLIIEYPKNTHIRHGISDSHVFYICCIRIIFLPICFLDG